MIDRESETGAVPDDLQAPSLVGGGQHVRGPAEEAVQPEEHLGSERSDTGSDSTSAAWVFCLDEPPQQFDPARIAEITAEDDNLAWIDISNYTESQLRELACPLDLREPEIHAALSSWQRPRLDIFGDHFFVSLTVPRLDSSERRVLAGELDLYVGRNFLLSVHKLPMPFADRVLTRAQHSPELVRYDSAYMLYIILDQLLEYYEDLYEEVQGEVDRMQERALTDLSSSFLSDLVQFKRYVAALTRLAEQHRQIFTAFLRPDFRFIGGDDVVMFFRDLDGRLSRLTDTLEVAQDAVNGAFDIYVSHVSHRTNQIIKVLTIVSTILLPVTVIVSFFGTSFRDLPIYDSSGFVVMLAAIGVVTIGILLAFLRRGWLF